MVSQNLNVNCLWNPFNKTTTKIKEICKDHNNLKKKTTKRRESLISFFSQVYIQGGINCQKHECLQLGKAQTRD